MLRNSTGLVVASLFATLAFTNACAGDPTKGPESAASPVDQEPATWPDATPPPTVQPTTPPAPSASVAASPPEITASAKPLLSDPQVLDVVHTANTGEIEQAKLAKTKTKDPRVKKLASMMLKDHSDADRKDLALAKKFDGSGPNATSQSLKHDAESATTTLESESGTDFDKGYVDTQVKEHQAVLDLIDQQLLPNAVDTDVKTFVTAVREKVALHLKHAKDLQTQLTQ